MVEGLSLDPFPLLDDGLFPAEVDIDRRHVAEGYLELGSLLPKGNVRFWVESSPFCGAD